MTRKRKKTFGKRLREFRKAQAHSEAAFAKGLGIRATILTGLETDMLRPSDEILIRLATATPADLNELLTGTPSPAAAAEVAALRKIKHEARTILNGVRDRIGKLGRIKRTTKSLIDEIDQETETKLKRKAVSHDCKQRKSKR